jgi:hypothetical protein
MRSHDAPLAYPIMKGGFNLVRECKQSKKNAWPSKEKYLKTQY